jgi:hypothetical protein
MAIFVKKNFSPGKKPGTAIFLDSRLRKPQRNIRHVAMEKSTLI